MEHDLKPGQRYYYCPPQVNTRFIAEICDDINYIKIVQVLKSSNHKLNEIQTHSLDQYPSWWVYLPNQDRIQNV